MERFEKLGLDKELTRNLPEHFEAPTEVQEKTIPLVLRGRDVIASSATGSGKTLAFASGMIQSITPSGEVQALVITPTRELAEQVAKAIKDFSSHKGLRVEAVFGGVPMDKQLARTRRVDVLVATPGRLLDHLGRKTISLRHVKTLVLDEADRMLDMGFLEDVEKIIKQCPSEKQVLLFSATMPPEVKRLAQKYLRNPAHVACQPEVSPEKLKQVYYDVKPWEKFSLLVHLLREDRGGLSMVFCNTRRSTDYLEKQLRRAGVSAIAIHGGLTQPARNKAMRTFNTGEVKVLICTDVAARGLDIKGVEKVYNYDIPRDPKDYIHRIGRTARAGAEGLAVNLLSERDHDSFSRLLRDYPVRVERREKPRFEKLKLESPQRRPRTMFRNRRR